jgi:uncharacterized RmlC-like cupin family protein
MSLSKGVEIHPLTSAKAGMIRFNPPQATQEAMLVKIPANTIEDMFVHKYQTDQLIVVRGSFILVVLHDRQYQYIPLSWKDPKVVTIPPLVPHAAINLGSEPCMSINAVIRHGRAHPSDYQPRKAPFAYDFDLLNRLFSSREGDRIAA